MQVIAGLTVAIVALLVGFLAGLFASDSQMSLEAKRRCFEIAVSIEDIRKCRGL